jgi:hypothetical protein
MDRLRRLRPLSGGNRRARLRRTTAVGIAAEQFLCAVNQIRHHCGNGELAYQTPSGGTDQSRGVEKGEAVTTVIAAVTISPPIRCRGSYVRALAFRQRSTAIKYSLLRRRGSDLDEYRKTCILGICLTETTICCLPGSQKRADDLAQPRLPPHQFGALLVGVVVTIAGAPQASLDMSQHGSDTCSHTLR